MKRLALSVAAVVGCISLVAVSSAGASVRTIETPMPGWIGMQASSDEIEAAEGTLRHVHAFGLASARSSFWGGGRTTSTGDLVGVYASDSYPDSPENEAALQAIAEFVATLPHSTELAHLNIYVLTPDEISYNCGAQALACYGTGGSGVGLLLIPGAWPAGFPGVEVLTHEYGHHIAMYRDNAPWPAIDWGPKRWATAMGICGRVAAGTAFPGDEDAHYYFNPGEAWAENYRLAVWGANAQLPLNVDPSFAPVSTALSEALADARTPWTPALSALSGKLVAPAAAKKPAKKKPKKKPGKKKPTVRHATNQALLPARTFTLATPHDGLLTLSLGKAPVGTLLSVFDASTGALLSAPNIGASVTLCGVRSVKVIVDGPAAGSFGVSVTDP